jgi:hypothetical protein
MDQGIEAFENALWAVLEGHATAPQQAAYDADPARTRLALERMLDETSETLAAVRRLPEHERGPVVADFEDQLALLEGVLGIERPKPGAAARPAPPVVYEPVEGADPVDEVRIQASWTGRRLVVWAGGPEVAPATADELTELLRAAGAPGSGWSDHAEVPLPGGAKAHARSIEVTDALGWLVAIGSGQGGSDQVGASLRWVGAVGVLAVRLVAQGRAVPTLLGRKRSDGAALDLAVRWKPALVDPAALAELADHLPGPVTVLAPTPAPTAVQHVLEAMVDIIARQGAARLELPAPPPVTRTTGAVAEAVVTRLDGSAFEAPVAAGAEVSKRLARWVRPVAGSIDGPTLIAQLDPPDSGDAWFLQVLVANPSGPPSPILPLLNDAKAGKALSDELLRLERLVAPLRRVSAARRGQVFLSQAEAWELMTVTGAALEAAGFVVRVPALSRKAPSPKLRLFTEPMGESVVGADQLSAVRWSAVFGDVELTAADIQRLANEARPLVRSHGRWVELSRADLKEAAAALAERASTTELSGAEILRLAVGLDDSPLGSGIDIEGAGWVTDLLARARDIPTAPITKPEGFQGELRSYQAEALGWLGFLDDVGLGGCLALDMGLGKTPTVLAHLGRTAGDGPALVIAPPAVVGNWAAEAARFTPGLRVVVHHGASRASAQELEREVAGADIVITTYGTAVRDVEALSSHHWDRLVLDEAQAIKNASNETAQQLRRIRAGTRIALTGTPIENGLGDLWAILDFVNPGLVGPRPTFIAQLSGEGEAALRALNGILVFRRTKTEPEVAAELPDRIDELDHCTMTPEQIGLYQAVLDGVVKAAAAGDGAEPKQGAILAAITALKQICNHPAAYQDDGRPLAGRSGKLTRLEEIVESVFAAGERILIFTHFATWGMRLADHLTEHTGVPIACYHGGLARGARDRMIAEFQAGTGAGALVLSLKAGGTGLNLTAASHVVLYDRWWNPAVEDQARDRAWRIGQTRTVVSHRLVCPGTVDERVEEVVQGKRHIADVVLPKSSSLADLDAEQLRRALGLRPELLLTDEPEMSEVSA